MEPAFSLSSLSPRYSEEYSPSFTPNRKQCKERRDNWARPGLNKDKWSDSELELLKQKYPTYGTSWSRYQADFPGRSQKMIQYRCESLYGRIKKNRSSPIQNKQIICLPTYRKIPHKASSGNATTSSVQVEKSVEKLTKRKFETTHQSTKNNQFVKNKKTKHDKTGEKTLSRRSLIWSKKQDKSLHHLVTEHVNKWTTISKLLAPQFQDFVPSPRQCKDRWTKHVKERFDKKALNDAESVISKGKSIDVTGEIFFRVYSDIKQEYESYYILRDDQSTIIPSREQEQPIPLHSGIFQKNERSYLPEAQVDRAPYYEPEPLPATIEGPPEIFEEFDVSTFLN